MNVEDIEYKGVQLVFTTLALFVVLSLGFGFVALLAIKIDNADIDLQVFTTTRYYIHVFGLALALSILMDMIEEIIHKVSTIVGGVSNGQ